VIPAISAALGPLNTNEWNVGGVGGLGGGAITNSPATSGSGSFSGALTNAIDGLQQTQSGADTASQALATGQATDPTQAITAVENASLAMDLASQISTKLTTAANTIFQTQI
jgi:flagellar hook-basal body complex protein FliE